MPSRAFLPHGQGSGPHQGPAAFAGQRRCRAILPLDIFLAERAGAAHGRGRAPGNPERPPPAALAASAGSREQVVAKVMSTTWPIARLTSRSAPETPHFCPGKVTAAPSSQRESKEMPMVIAYIAVGLLAGSVAALSALLAGYSSGAAFAFYILAGNLGAGSVALVVALHRPARERSGAEWRDGPLAGSGAAGRPASAEESRQRQRAALSAASSSLVPTHPSRSRQTREHRDRTSHLQ